MCLDFVSLMKCGFSELNVVYFCNIVVWFCEFKSMFLIVYVVIIIRSVIVGGSLFL